MKTVLFLGLMLLLCASAQAEKQSLFGKIRRRLQQTFETTNDASDNGECNDTYGAFIECAILNFVSCATSCVLMNPGLVPGEGCEAFNTFYDGNNGCCAGDACGAALEALNACKSCANAEPTAVLTISPTISPPTELTTLPTVLPTIPPTTSVPQTEAPQTNAPTSAPTPKPTESSTQQDTVMPQLDVMSMSMSMDIDTPSPTTTTPLPPVTSPTLSPTAPITCMESYASFVECTIINIADCDACDRSFDSMVAGENCPEFNTWYNANVGCCNGDMCGSLLESFKECKNCPEAPAPTAAPTEQCFIPGCCVEDCCGPGTSWDAAIEYCIPNADSLGWNGTYESEYERGCLERSCCEGDCCSSGTVFDAGIKCCVPVVVPS